MKHKDTQSCECDEGPRHPLRVGAYERDVWAGRFAGTREQWRRWTHDPEAYEQRARARRLREHQAKRYGLTERTGEALRVVQYDDPSVPLECVTDYASPLFDQDTREWFMHHAQLCRPTPLPPSAE